MPTRYQLFHPIAARGRRLAHELLLLPLIFAGLLLAEELLFEPRVPVILYVIIRPSRQLRRYYRPPTTAACMVCSDNRFYDTHVAALANMLQLIILQLILIKEILGR
jgi:hypothetical protein